MEKNFGTFDGGGKGKGHCLLEFGFNFYLPDLGLG